VLEFNKEYIFAYFIVLIKNRSLIQKFSVLKLSVLKVKT